MSLTANLFHAASTVLATVPVTAVARGAFHAAAIGGGLVFFRPLLSGIGRALLLTVRPRPTRAQQTARRLQAAARG